MARVIDAPLLINCDAMDERNASFLEVIGGEVLHFDGARRFGRMTIHQLRTVRCTQRHAVVWSACSTRSSTSRSDSEYRRYQRTAQRIKTGPVATHRLQPIRLEGSVVILALYFGTRRV